MAFLLKEIQNTGRQGSLLISFREIYGEIDRILSRPNSPSMPRFSWKKQADMIASICWTRDADRRIDVLVWNGSLWSHSWTQDLFTKWSHLAKNSSQSHIRYWYVCIMITLTVRIPGWHQKTKSVSLLPMPWLHTSPGNQQTFPLK